MVRSYNDDGYAKIIHVKILPQGNCFLFPAGQAGRFPAAPPVSKRHTTRLVKEKKRCRCAIVVFFGC